MPHRMKSEEVAKQLGSHLHGVGAKLQCPVCDSRQWSIGEMIAPVVTKDFPPKTPIREGCPLLPLICDTCQYVRLFAVAKILTTGLAGAGRST